MSAPAHTPGPWMVGPDDGNGQAVVRGEHIEVATCWHHCVGSIEQQMRANARLIAAAPELLAALIAMEAEKADYMQINHLGDPASQHTNRTARAAIAKATGQEGSEAGDELAREGSVSGMNPKKGSRQ